jgi:hypothetical protein
VIKTERAFRTHLPRRTRWGLWVAAATALAFVLLRAAPEFTEAVYSRGIYPAIATALSAVSGRLPFSVGEIFVGAILALIAADSIRGWVLARRAGASIPSAAGRYLLRALAGFGWMWATFMLLWGLNYARPHPPELFSLDESVDVERRRQLVERIGERVDAMRAMVPEDARGVAAVGSDLALLDAKIAVLQERSLARAGFPVIGAGSAKRLIASPLLLRWGVSGVYGPFSAEPGLVLPAAPTTLPFVVAHERAHLAGFAWEEAASFAALLTLWESEDPRLLYSAWFALWRWCASNVEERSPGVVRDLLAIREFDRTHRGVEAPATRRAYDTYLRAHGVAGGRESYGRVEDLALRYLAARGFPD